MTQSLYDAAEAFVAWLDLKVTDAGRGSDVSSLAVDPDGVFWLGRLAPEAVVVDRGMGDRGERLDPCAMGIRFLVEGSPPWTCTATIRGCVWLRVEKDHWVKSARFAVPVSIQIDDGRHADHEFGMVELATALSDAAATPGLTAVLRVEVRPQKDQLTEITLLVVNASPAEHDTLKDTNLYEVELSVQDLDTVPFVLEALPDAFRYDRRIVAYGVNCGVERVTPTSFLSTDTVVAHRGRPEYWSSNAAEPDLSFSTLATAPLPSLSGLVDAISGWADGAWSDQALALRASDESWEHGMIEQAKAEAALFWAELARLRHGLELLSDDADLLRSFQLMNDAMSHASQGRYSGWRPFQIGFLLANLACLVDPMNDSAIADVIWFATGGGKTETYLGLLVMAALLDRTKGKAAGVTAWSRFPLRMLSLQQTQRFANAMAGAELARRGQGIGGEPFSVGFLVGQGGTPNRIRPEPANSWEPDPDDDDMPARYLVLLTCPFCHESSIEMAFDRLTWCLEHRCVNGGCPWPERALPFYIVDDEIYRFLPTVIVGTLDKAASISLQAAMRGLVGPPHGVCSEAGHGFTYAPRSTKPNGCLVPGCPGSRQPLAAEAHHFGPRFRLQDELHLLRDSLGAVDAHYESLLDHLQLELATNRPKILASSATLTGYEHQVDVLYRREARVFPLPGPSPADNFWTNEGSRLARRFVAVAPRGQTLEFTVDKMLTQLQQQVRRLVTEPTAVCQEAAIDPVFVPELLSLYGTDVVYGNTLRDLDAALRSTETQVNVEGPLNTAPLTGRTPFEEVRETLSRLEDPEADFGERLHIIGASSMMSHGVDIDRLNVMVMLGLPLTTAEFIQTTARVGRRWPGLAYVITKIAREREAAVFRSFEAFVRQGDRFVEPVPVTRRSRRVLERTLPGLELARVLAVHEPRSLKSLATVKSLREYCEGHEINASSEFAALVDALGLTDPLDERLREDAERWLEEYFHHLFEPVGSARFPGDLCPGERRPMLSLRDVEEQAPVVGTLS